MSDEILKHVSDGLLSILLPFDFLRGRTDLEDRIVP